jgi:hypothetical protein
MVNVASTNINLTEYQNRQNTGGDVCTSTGKFSSKGVIRDIAFIGLFYLLRIFEE